MEIQFMFPQFHFKVLVFSDVSNYNMKNICMCFVVKRNSTLKVFTLKNTISKQYNNEAITVFSLIIISFEGKLQPPISGGLEND